MQQGAHVARVSSCNSKTTAVLVGLGTSIIDEPKHSTSKDTGNFSLYAGTGSSAAIASGRLSFVFGFAGACLTVDTACSSSLVATHVGASMLNELDCSSAIAIGAQLIT